MDELGRVKIYRYDPSQDRKERYDTLEDIPYEGYTILNVLDYIFKERDTSIAYRGALCTKGFCGGCSVMVNGKPVMACHTLAEKEMTIEPHPSFKIIKDLVCDWEKEEENPRTSKQKIKITFNEDNCNQCRDCVKICVLNVFEVVDKRVKAVHPERCMGLTCRICMDTCWRRGVTVEESGNGG